MAPGSKLVKRILFRVARAAVVALLTVAGCVMFFESRFIYYPTRYPDGDWDAPRHGAVPVSDVELTASDGVKLHGWLAGAAAAPIVLLYFHGNAGNLSYRYEWTAALTSLPARVLAIDYRGYGKSGGSPDEAGLYRDADAAYDHAAKALGASPEQIIIYGKSLGGAVACDLAARRPCRAVILQSTFTNVPDMARSLLPFLPASWFVRSRFDSLKKIPAITAPKLIVHSRADELIPAAMGERLFRAASEPKRLLLFDGAGHNDLVWLHQRPLLDAFRQVALTVE